MERPGSLRFAPSRAIPKLYLSRVKQNWWCFIQHIAVQEHAFLQSVNIFQSWRFLRSDLNLLTGLLLAQARFSVGLYRAFQLRKLLDQRDSSWFLGADRHRDVPRALLT